MVAKEISPGRAIGRMDRLEEGDGVAAVVFRKEGEDIAVVVEAVRPSRIGLLEKFDIGSEGGMDFGRLCILQTTR